MLINDMQCKKYRTTMNASNTTKHNKHKQKYGNNFDKTLTWKKVLNKSKIVKWKLKTVPVTHCLLRIRSFHALQNAASKME